MSLTAHLLVAIALLLTPGGAAGSSAAAWGEKGHALITETAIDGLPAVLKSYYAEHREFIARHSVDPDLWRRAERDRDAAQGSGSVLCRPERGLEPLEGDEGPRHFLDADELGAFPFREIPRRFDEYRRLVGTRFEHLGSAPWAIGSYSERLTAAMRNGDRRQILCVSAVLSHYVADFSQPLHLTRNFDGQFSGLDGVHYRFETLLLDHYIGALKQSLQAATPRAELLDEPVEAAFQMLVDGYPAADNVLAADLGARSELGIRKGRHRDDSRAYLEALWRRAGDLLRQRLLYGAKMLASYWLTAWERAGRPQLSPS